MVYVFVCKVHACKDCAPVCDSNPNNNHNPDHNPNNNPNLVIQQQVRGQFNTDSNPYCLNPNTLTLTLTLTLTQPWP